MTSAEAPQSVLDDAVWASLAGPHAALALRSGNARRYPPGQPAFAAFRGRQEAGLRDLSALVPPGDAVAVAVPLAEPIGADWNLLPPISLTQMLCETPIDAPERVGRELSPADADDMLVLVEATRPGPFGRRSIEMGRFIGVRVAGELVAMAGERLHPPGFTEISAVCTRADHRGKGLAEKLTREIASQIQARGELPFLHVAAESESTRDLIRWYRRMGFRERRPLALPILQRKPDSAD